MRFSPSLLSLVAAAAFVAAHPGDDHAHEAAVRRAFLNNNAPNLAHCADKLQSLGVTERATQRRLITARGIREKRGIITKRGEHESHEDYSIDTDPSVLFGSGASCVLAPDVTEGPYYVTGEDIRSDLVEDQKGIPLHIDVQFINSVTCEPVDGAYVDAWQANSTGVYGGVVAEENGSGPADQSNWKTTFLRGVQKTDADGVVQFETIFPGHYAGRTAHIHVLAHLNAHPTPENTIIDVSASHVGQAYFDQDLIAQVETYPPYSTNNQPMISNDEDFILQEDIRAGGNPFMEYHLLGDTVEDGILAWLSFGINATSSRDVYAATTRVA